MDNVAYEVYDLYPLPPPNKAWGQVSKWFKHFFFLKLTFYFKVEAWNFQGFFFTFNVFLFSL